MLTMLMSSPLAIKTSYKALTKESQKGNVCGIKIKDAKLTDLIRHLKTNLDRFSC